MPDNILTQLAASNAKLDSMLPSTGADESPKLTAAEIFTQISSELQKGNVSKERAAYHLAVIAEVSKNNFEATSFTPLKVLDDPMRTNPKSESIGTIQSLTTSEPKGSTFASNMTKQEKAAALQKAILDKEAIKKGVYSDKLEDIMSLFRIDPEDLHEEYELRWKVGDLISQLQSAAKLEALVEKSAAPEKQAEKPVEDKPVVWPRDMASAKLDPATNTYSAEKSQWDSDAPSGS